MISGVLRSRLLLPAVLAAALLVAGCDLAARSEVRTAAPQDGADAAPPALPPVAEAPSGPFECDGVQIRPGDDLAAIADREPPGTTFCIRSGVHRVGGVRAETGDQFIGESGAVLNGARDLSAVAVQWKRSGDAWVIGGQTQESEPLTVCHHAEKGCIEGAGPVVHPNQYNEELFADNRRLQRVASRDQLGPGRWYFDMAADEIWLGEDPAGLGTIEATVHQGAIGSAGGATDVVIDNLVVEKYGSWPGRGALGGWDPSSRDKTRDFRWHFRNITGQLNHGAAVQLMEGDRLENCRLTHNGQMGFKALGHLDKNTHQAIPKDFDQRIIVRNCEIAHNNQLGYRAGWEAGGFKITEAVGGSVVENVWSHDNDGAGMWWDGFNRDAIVRSNLVEDNTMAGIHYEISYGHSKIYWNIVRDNGVHADHPYASKGIYLSNAEGVDVFQNAVAGSDMALHIRADGNRQPAARNNKIYENDFEPAAENACNGVGTFSGEGGAATPQAGNQFQGNVWRLKNPDAAAFCFGDGSRSRLSIDDAPMADEVVGGGRVELPAEAKPFTKREFGAR